MGVSRPILLFGAAYAIQLMTVTTFATSQSKRASQVCGNGGSHQFKFPDQCASGSLGINEMEPLPNPNGSELEAYLQGIGGNRSQSC
eukprot:c16448_g2_i1.p1 GENE.c16448_g2_i1~~c16448_g2_i1.p1  ORF type:complete len:100 (+),score=13.01 c16448_g2_i1:41-301(+)